MGKGGIGGGMKADVVDLNFLESCGWSVYCIKGTTSESDSEVELTCILQ